MKTQSFTLLRLVLVIGLLVPAGALPIEAPIRPPSTYESNPLGQEPSPYATTIHPRQAQRTRALQQSQNVELIGQIGGGIDSAAVEGNFAYITVGPRLVILDISNPSQPTVVGRTNVLPNSMERLAVAGQYVYMTDSGSNIRIIDVANPSMPNEAGIYQLPEAANAIVVSGIHAYVADGSSGLRILNVANPATPVETSFFKPSGTAYTVAAAGAYAYVGSSDGLHIINAANAAAPTEVGFYAAPLGYNRSLVADGMYAYVVDSQSLHVINVANPSAPTQVGTYQASGGAFGVAGAWPYVYVAGGNFLDIVDVSNPAAPTKISSYAGLAFAVDVTSVGAYAYVVDQTFGLHFINLTNPATPTEASFYYTPGRANDIAVAGNYAYYTNIDYYTGNLAVVNVTNPAAPTWVSFTYASLSQRIIVSGTYAYVAGGVPGYLRIFSIVNQAAPTQVGAYSAPQTAWDVAVVGSYAYIADDSQGLRIVNISNPAAPSEAGFYITPGRAMHVAVSGNYAYVSTGSSGLRVINVADKSAPTEVGSYAPLGSVNDVALWDNYALVTASDGLHVVDVSNPAAPTVAGFYSIPACGVTVAGNYAYVTDGNLHVFDITNPANLVEVGFYATTGGACHVALAGNYVYAADGTGGLFILRYTGGVSLSCFSLSTTASGVGVVTVTTPTNCAGGYTAGTVVTLAASANSGYTFAGWGGGASGTSSLADVVMTNNTSVTANFVPISVSQKPVVVLVHGWHGLSLHPDNCNTGIVPYTSGIPTDFGMFPDALAADGFDVYIAHLDTQLGSTPLVDMNADCLAWQIAQARRASQVSNVILITHSMGGLVARAYLESSRYQGDVSRLITLGTPHAGTSYGIVGLGTLCLGDQAACEFTPLAMVVFNAVLHPARAQGVQYTLIGGNLNPTVGLPLQLCDGDNDGVVGSNSGMGRLFNACLPALPLGVIVPSVSGSAVTRYQFNVSHPTGITFLNMDFPSYFRRTTISDTTPTQVYQCVRKVLGVANPNAQCPSPITNVAAPAVDNPTLSELPAASGHLFPSQVVTQIVPVDTAGLSQFTLTWLTGTVGLTLTNPLGTVIDSAYATTHPSIVKYEENASDPDFPLMAQYTFTTTVAGVYTLTVSADAVPVAGTDWRTIVVVDSPRTLTVSTNNLIYAVGNTATITASVQNAGVGLAGANVQAQLHRPGLVTDTATLLDRGGGIYTGTYAIPNIPGYLGLTVVAQGNDSGTVYARQVDSLLAVSPPTLQLTGQYFDSPQDYDGNGKYESLNVGISVTSTQAGNYLLSGDLVGTNDVLVAHSVVSLTLGTGVVTATLPFNGDAMRRSQLNGPYSLTSLTIADQQYAGVPTIWQASNVWTTAAYDWHDFAATCYVLDITGNPAAGGQAAANTPPNCNVGQQYTSDSVVTLTATANTNYIFANWSGNATGVSNPVSVTLDADKSVVADFSSTPPLAGFRLYLPLIRH